MSLSNKAMLVSLTITKPQMTQKDKAASDDVATVNQANTSAVAVVKRLYPKHLINPIMEIEAEARRYIDSVTGASVIRGLSVLPCQLFMDFTDKIGQYKLRFEQAVTVFMLNIANVMQQAQHEQGTLFDAGAYPDVRQMRAQFSFGVQYMQIADAATMLLDLEAGTMADVRTQVEKQTRELLQANQAKAVKRLVEAVQRIATQCGKPDGKIYDSLTGNLRELLDIMPALNLADDPELANACRAARALVVAPETIKASPDIRASTAAEAARILKAMEMFAA